MVEPFRSWRDTLQELGVMGLIPAPGGRDAVIEKQREIILDQSPPHMEQEKNSMDQPPRKAPGPPRQEVPKMRPAAAREAAPEPASQPRADDPVAFPPPERVAGSTTLASLEAGICVCLACPLGGGRVRFVFGEGDPEARMMFIGEGPGRDEDLTGRPFVGKAGELLDKMLGAIGMQRSQVYIANIVKCRPPDNRTPTSAEAQRCLPYLRRQIELVRPGVIVTLGATPLRELLGVQTGITRIRGQWQRLDMLGGIPVMPTFHPAYVLRQYTQEVRRAVWSDLVAARKWLEEPTAPNP
jgi:DNA polymerase